MDRRAKRELMRRLECDAELLASRFGLRYKAIEPERLGVRNRYGACFADGVIKIRLRHAVTGRPLKYSSLVNTLCHELAHLRHFHHGDRFKAFYLQILAYARARGIYQPAAALRPGVADREETPGAAAIRAPRVPVGLARPEIRPEPAVGPVQLGLFGGWV